MKKDTLYGIVLKNQKKFYFVVIFIEVITYTTSFLISGLVKKDIFNVLERRNTTLGIYALNLLILLNVGMPLLINVIKQVDSGLVAKVESQLRKNLKKQLLKDSYAEGFGGSGKYGYGEKISFFRNECEDIISYLMQYYRQLPKIVLGITILIVMIFINPIFTIISLIPTFGILILTKFFGNYIIRNREMVRNSSSEVNSYLENIFDHIEYYKLAVDNEKLESIFREKCRVRAKNEIKDRMLERILGIVSENSANFVLGIILLSAIPFYRNGSFSIGEFVMFEYYYAFLASLPDSLAQLIRSYKQAQVAIGRMSFNRSQNNYGYAKSDNGNIYIEMDIERQHINLKIHAGETVLLRGGSEMERSFILQEIFNVCKRDIINLNSQYVSQQPILFNDSICNNICFGTEYDEERMKQVLIDADLKEDIISFEEGIEKTVGKWGTTVSGGQQKRICIARALYLGGAILFIDGLSEMVDRNTEKTIISNILNEERITFVASNKESMIKEANHIITI